MRFEGGEPFDTDLFDAEPSSYNLDYDTGTAKFSIYETQNAGKNLATAMRLVTDDFDAFHTYLLSKGVVFETYDIDENFHEPNGTPYFDNGALISPRRREDSVVQGLLAVGSSW